MIRRSIITCVCLGFLAVSALAQQPDATRMKALGQHLSRECVTCHRLDGADSSIPAIVGWAVAEFVETMGYYKGGQRPNPAMVSVAQSLDDEQVRALAEWFGSLAKAKKR